jgi:hypothetical protein
MFTAREPTVLLADSKAIADNVQQNATDKAAISPKWDWIMLKISSKGIFLCTEKSIH